MSGDSVSSSPILEAFNEEPGPPCPGRTPNGLFIERNLVDHAKEQIRQEELLLLTVFRVI